MDVQNEILDFLGDQYTEKMLNTEFTGKTERQIIKKLNVWFPTEENDALARKIFDYLRVHSAAVALGRKGGTATSAAKKKSSAANGRLGGRPKKSVSSI